MSDLFLHQIEYFVFALQYFLFWGNKRNYGFLIVFMLFFAFSDELHQYFVPGRDSSFSDLIADYVGISLAFLLVKYKDIRLKKGV